MFVKKVVRGRAVQSFSNFPAKSLVKMYVNVICLPTEHQGVHRTRSEMSVHSRIEFEQIFERHLFN